MANIAIRELKEDFVLYDVPNSDFSILLVSKRVLYAAGLQNWGSDMATSEYKDYFWNGEHYRYKRVEELKSRV